MHPIIMGSRKSTDCFSFMMLLAVFINSINGQAPEVTTAKGTIQGTTLQTRYNRSISGFLGIPYAQPPIGDLRFSAPVEVDAWSTTLDASTDPNMCPQLSGTVIIGNEDCLYLNVYTPQLPDDENATPLPVMFWITGGSFNSGGGIMRLYGPEYLLDQDVVLVSINYRLGALGFLSTGDEVALGNWGMKDMVLALQWVQDNIAYFGGDPDQVTIFGESSGSTAVHLLTLSDTTVGLFHRYIMQSGTALAPWAYQPRATMVQRAAQLGEYLGCSTDSSTLLINCLRELDSSTIINTDSIYPGWDTIPLYPWLPTDEPDVEGAFLTDSPENLLDAGKARDVPSIVGVNKNEAAFIMITILIDSTLFDKFMDNFDTALPLVLGTEALYDNLTAYANTLKSYYFPDLTANRSTLMSNFMDLSNDALFFYPTYSGLEKQAALIRSCQFFYTFDYRGAISFTDVFSATDYGTSHGDDLLYLFPGFGTLYGLGEVHSEADLEMLDIMVELWTSFATNGIPTTTKSDTFWEPYSPRCSHLQIGNEADLALDNEYTFYDDRMQFWATLSV